MQESWVRSLGQEDPLEKVKPFSRVQLFMTPWTVACRAPLSMEFYRQEYWSGLPFPSPGDLPDTGIEPRSPTLQADSLPSKPPGKPKRRKWPLTPVFLPRKCHGQRSLVGYRPWGHKRLQHDLVTKQQQHSFHPHFPRLHPLVYP